MKCTRCGRESHPDANFCGECGGELNLVCLICRTELPARSKFCQKCASPVSGARSVDEPIRQRAAKVRSLDEPIGQRASKAAVAIWGGVGAATAFAVYEY